MNIHEPLSALLERAGKAVVQKKPWASWTEAERLRSMADAMVSCAAEIQAAYDEQKRGLVNWRLTLDDVSRVTRVALSYRHRADVWEWQQEPLVAQRLRAGLSVDNVDGVPPRPTVPPTGIVTPHDLPPGFPELCLSWSEMATEFLSTRRGKREVSDGPDRRDLD
jgi:hypothetical protein